jgi:hypothetical protein
MTHPHWSYDIGKTHFIQPKLPIFSETPEKEPRLTFHRYVKAGKSGILPGFPFTALPGLPFFPADRG